MIEEITYWVTANGRPKIETKRVNEDGSVRSVVNQVNGKVITLEEYTALKAKADAASTAAREALRQAEANAMAEAAIQEAEDADRADLAYDEAIALEWPEILAVAVAKAFRPDFEAPLA